MVALEKYLRSLRDKTLAGEYECNGCGKIRLLRDVVHGWKCRCGFYEDLDRVKEEIEA